MGCILRAGIKFCHHCPWAICYCAASSFQSRLLLLSAWYETWNRTPNLGRKKDNLFSSIVGIAVLEVREMQPPFSSANDPVHSGAAVLASAASWEMLGWIGLFPAEGSSWWKALSAQRAPSVLKWAVTATSGDRELPSRLQRAEHQANPLKLYLFLLYQGSDIRVTETGLLKQEFLKKIDIYHWELFLPLSFSRHGQYFNSSRCSELNPIPLLFSSHSMSPPSHNPDHRNAHHCLSN